MKMKDSGSEMHPPLTKRKAGASSRRSGDTEMKDEQEMADDSNFSFSDTGAITKCYTVMKLEPKNKNKAAKQKKTPIKEDPESDSMTNKEETMNRKPEVKQAGIYQMLMMVTHSLKEKKKNTKKVVSSGATASQLRESQNR
jgi:hypothetical protein